MTTSKLDCLEKILEESMTEKSRNDSRCLEEYTALCLKIGTLENDLEESKGTIAGLQTHMSILQDESRTANEQLDDLRSKAADQERVINDKMKVLLFEKKSVESDLSDARADLRNMDRISFKKCNTPMGDRGSHDAQLKSIEEIMRLQSEHETFCGSGSR